MSPDCEQIGNRPTQAHSRKTLEDSAHDQVLGQIRIKAVGTTWDPADLGTKTLSVDRHKMLGYMLNMLLDGDRMGEQQYLRATQADWNKHTIEEIRNVSSSLAPQVQHNIVVVMNPELSKPYGPLHTSLVRNEGELPSVLCKCQ